MGSSVVSIFSLIYKSAAYAQHLWEMLWRTTPELGTGKAEFFFVANDASEEVLYYLQREGVPHVVQCNPRLTEEEMFRMGYGRPEYIRRVYQGLNRGIVEARTDCLVILSSDHVMCEGWLEAMCRVWNPRLALSTLTIEPGNKTKVFNARLGKGTGAVRGDYGNTLSEFDAESFITHACTLTQNLVTPGGAHQPTMFSKAVLLEAGLYPEGNVHDGSYQRIKEFGDRRLFRILEEQGVRHVTYHGTVAYHFQEGEMREVERK